MKRSLMALMFGTMAFGLTGCPKKSMSAKTFEERNVGVNVDCRICPASENIRDLDTGLYMFPQQRGAH